MSILNSFRLFSQKKQLPKDDTTPQKHETCLVCGASASYLDAVDFNKSCEEARRKFLPNSGRLIEYFICDQCGFCFAPEFRYWTFGDFERDIYNSDYEAVDPDYKLSRPIGNAEFLTEQFGLHKDKIRHLDYGGGSGLLSATLNQRGWTSNTYDPFVNRDKNPGELGNFDLVTGFEVCEHSPDPIHLFDTLKKLCKPTGMILFSTMLSDGQIARSKKLEWWYAAPRNGHISLFSQQSLIQLAQQRNMYLVTFSPNLHGMFSYLPNWARHMMRNPESVPSADSYVPVEAEAAKNRGNEFAMSNNFYPALLCYQEALDLWPSYAEAKVNLGMALRQLGRLQEAKHNLQEAIALKPTLWQGHFQLGVVLYRLGEFQQAVDSYRHTIELNADFPECQWQLGLSLVKLSRWQEAVRAFGVANVPDQQLQEVHATYALALLKTNQLVQALHECQIALNLGETSDLHFLTGLVYEGLSLKPEAELSYRNAIASDANNSDAHYFLAFLRLLQGDFLNGFTHYEHRLKLRDAAEWLIPIKTLITSLGTDRYWKGQVISGTTILIITEQGLGDSLMMLRYVPLLKTSIGAARICVVCDEPLARIFQSIPEVDEVRVKPEIITTTDFDWYCTTMSLPNRFRTELHNIPACPQLQITQQQKSQWAERLAPLKGLKVGIAWSGNNRLDSDDVRSIKLSTLAPLFSIPGISWVSLQKGQASQELQSTDFAIHDWMDDASDLMDTAALIDCLDLVITVDTSVVHLAGASGRPTWLLNRFDTEWRWLLERDDSVWYPNVRIRRQTIQNDWDSLINKVADDLRRRVHN